MKRSWIGAGAKSLERGSTFKRQDPDERPIDYATRQAVGSKPKRRKARGSVTVQAQGQRAAWAAHGRTGLCLVCGHRPATQGHHIVTQQELRKAAVDTGVELAAIRWDRRNLLPVCDGCHANHHSRSRPISLAVLRVHAPLVFAFAAEVGRAWWLTRTYPDGTEVPDAER